MPLVLIFAVALFLAFLPNSAPAFTGKLVKALDGDTVEVMREGKAERIRLSEIDAPESNQPFGQASKRFVLEVAAQQIVTVAVRTTDRYGRTVGEVFLPDGRSLNRELVRQGLAWHYKQYSRDASLADLENEARAARRGLWGEPHPIPPWEFRRGGSQSAQQSTGTSSPMVAAEKKSQEVFVARSGSKYHREGCQHLKSRTSLGLAEAKRRGYEPCKVCQPSQ